MKQKQATKRNPEYKFDFRKEKPALHLLYVKWACKHLTIIDECMQRLSDQSNLNLTDMLAAMEQERAKLILENAAYADAQEILDLIGGKPEENDEGEELIDASEE